MLKEVKFNAERRKDKSGNLIIENVPIRMSFFVADGRLEYYTQVRILNLKNFDGNAKSHIKANEPEAARKNKILKDIKVKAESIYDGAIALELQPTKAYVKAKLDEHFKNKVIKSDKVSVKEAFDEFLNEVKVKRSERTWKKHNTTKNHLLTLLGKEFDKLEFVNIDSAFVERFRTGIIKKGYNQGENKIEYLNNTVVKYIRSFREFLNWCKDEKRNYYSGNAKFEDLRENEINVIYLDEQELQTLWEAEMPSDTLNRVKDVFLFGCYTGMRYSDIERLKKKDVLFEEGMIRFYVKKGKKTTWLNVPLVSESFEILTKYQNLPGESALPVLSNQKMNDYIKEVAKVAGFVQVLTIAEKMGNGKIVEKEYQKWELISCHTSRKTFISYAIANDMPEPVIKSITDHTKNSRAFTRYYEISQEKKREEMQKVFGKSKKNFLKAV